VSDSRWRVAQRGEEVALLANSCALRSWEQALQDSFFDQRGKDQAGARRGYYQL